ncbi:UDP-N-acetylglucosamine 2-epimerase, partial [Staphylococcus aureus]|uniref:UDP-N-acetylglucosamine 2-epimerase n=1 Tax=Staphylococcus aureus TaxID=1280 RepID=UPI001642BF3B
TTTFLRTFAAFYHQIPLPHLQPPLPTHHKYSPFPQHLNPLILTNIPQFNFPPTLIPPKNLLFQNKHKQPIFITPNTLIHTFSTTVQNHFLSTIINKHKHKKLILLTPHRPQNI